MGLHKLEKITHLNLRRDRDVIIGGCILLGITILITLAFNPWDKSPPKSNPDTYWSDIEQQDPYDLENPQQTTLDSKAGTVEIGN